MFLVFDPLYFWVVFIPTMLISLGVQIYLKRSFARWGNERNSSNLNGMQTGQQIFKKTSLKPITLERTPGVLTDHYDPRANVVRLSDGVASQPSIASMAVAAHELGHVQQYQSGSAWVKARNILLPALQFSPTLSYIAFMIGFLFNNMNMVWMGIFFFALMVLFSVLTLPLELNASRRAMNLLNEAGLLKTSKDRKGARQVLNAAALTYLAAAITSLLQLFYFITMARGQSRRRA